MTQMPDSLDLSRLGAAYSAGSLTPTELVRGIDTRLRTRGEDGVWIHRVPLAGLEARAEALESLDPAARAAMPLWGVPFSVKDCIDVAGVPTTAACPDYAYVPGSSNPGVQRLIDAGAIFVGKTNLDQFATGLVGTRTPYGIARNPFDPAVIPGGSSSGAGVSVAAGLVSFALGTDTGGSGRVPAAYTNTVGLKPTRGMISTRAMVPACRSLDCISVYALTVPDALAVFEVAAAPDPAQPYSRARAALAPDPWPGEAPLRIAVPGEADLDFLGDPVSETAFAEALAAFEAMGAEIARIDYAPFREVNAMMFQGPMVAEREAVFGDFLRRAPEAAHPVVGPIILGAERFSAADAYAMLHRLEALARSLAPVWREHAFMLVPTIARPHSVAELEAAPVAANFDHGLYTNFLNPLDLSAFAVPNGIAPDGLPRGVTLVGPAGAEARLAPVAERFHRRRSATLGATGAAHPG